MEKSESIKNIADALIVFQSKVDKIKKDSSNPFFKSKYASLSTIQNEIQLPLAEAGLCYTQMPEADNNLTTLLIHGKSGEYFQSTLQMHPVKTDPQSLGSAITYGKRYALVAILGLNIDDGDDDGNDASDKGKDKEPTIEKPKSESNTAALVNNEKLKWLNQNTSEWTEAVKYLQTEGASINRIEKKYSISKINKGKLIEDAQKVLA